MRPEAILVKPKEAALLNSHIDYDFIGLDSMTGKPLERIGTYIPNWIWSRDYRVFRAKDRLALFVGEPKAREELGYIEEPLIVCSIGGTRSFVYG